MQEILLKYFRNLDEQKIEKFNALLDIIEDWNKKVNLISRKEDRDQIKLRHILHSLSIAKIFSFEENSNIIDVGTGGGFPGIPLAIMFPQSNFLLVDGIKKKINVVDDIVNQLEIKNVKTSVSRVETINDNFDIVLSRAMASFPLLYQLTNGLIKKDKDKFQGIICLKGGDLEDELKGYKNIKIYSISDFFKEDFFETKKIIFMRK